MLVPGTLGSILKKRHAMKRNGFSLRCISSLIRIMVDTHDFYVFERYQKKPIKWHLFRITPSEENAVRLCMYIYMNDEHNVSPMF